MVGSADRLYQESTQIYALASDVEHVLDGVAREAGPLVSSGSWRGPTADRTTADLSQNQSRLRDLAYEARTEAYARWQAYCRELESLTRQMPGGPPVPSGLNGPPAPGMVPLPCPGPIPHR